jgi:hypothetical protein
MADHGSFGSADLQVILKRTDPARNVARYYALSIEAIWLQTWMLQSLTYWRSARQSGRRADLAG